MRNSKQAIILRPPVSQTQLNHRNIEGIKIPIYKEQEPVVFEKTDRYSAQQFDDSKPENCLQIKVVR